MIEASDLILDEALRHAQQQAMSGIAPVLAQEQVQSNPNNMYYTAMPQGTMANAMPPGAAMPQKIHMTV